MDAFIPLAIWIAILAAFSVRIAASNRARLRLEQRIREEPRQCGYCRHWGDGECRRFPPQVTLWPSDNQHPIAYQVVSTYPQCHADTPACGEFSTRIK